MKLNFIYLSIIVFLTFYSCKEKTLNNINKIVIKYDDSILQLEHRTPITCEQIEDYDTTITETDQINKIVKGFRKLINSNKSVKGHVDARICISLFNDSSIISKIAIGWRTGLEETPSDTSDYCIENLILYYKRPFIEFDHKVIRSDTTFAKVIMSYLPTDYLDWIFNEIRELKKK